MRCATRRAAERLVDVIAQERAHQLANVRRRAAAGEPPWVTWWPSTDGEGHSVADDAWLRVQRVALVAACSPTPAPG